MENDSDNRSSGRSSIVIAINDDSHANSVHIIRIDGDDAEDKKDDETEIDVGIDSDEEDEDDSNDQRELLLHKKNEKNNLGIEGGGGERIRYKHNFVEDEEDEQDDDIIVIVDEDSNLCGGGVSDELYLKLREMDDEGIAESGM